MSMYLLILLGNQSKMFTDFYFNSLDQEMQTLAYISAVCKHIWIDVIAKVGKNNNDDNLLRWSMVVDGIKESRTHTGSTCHVDHNFQSTHCYR